VFSSEKDDREHLRGEDAQEGGERIDGGVGDGGASEPAMFEAKARAGGSVIGLHTVFLISPGQDDFFLPPHQSKRHT
jgi:hypothetical protein